jgi:hypothetical protein
MPHKMRSIAATLVAPLLLLSPVLTAPLAAQTPSPLLGTWSIDWEVGRRIMNGDVTSIKAKGTLLIAASGDSLLATVTTVSRDDNAPPRPPVTLGGRLTATGAEFLQRSEAIMNTNGEERKQVITSTWTLTLDGKTLKGSIAREVPGMVEGNAASELTGTRVPD